MKTFICVATLRDEASFDRKKRGIQFVQAIDTHTYTRWLPKLAGGAHNLGKVHTISLSFVGIDLPRTKEEEEREREKKELGGFAI